MLRNMEFVVVNGESPDDIRHECYIAGIFFYKSGSSVA